MQITRRKEFIMKKILLLTLLIIALIICGCGSKDKTNSEVSNQTEPTIDTMQKNYTPEEQLAAFEEWKKSVDNEVLPTEKIYVNDGGKALTESENGMHDKAISDITTVDATIMSSMEKLSNIKIPLELKEEHQKRLQKSLANWSSYLESMHNRCLILKKMFENEKAGIPSKKSMEEVQSLFNAALNNITDAHTEMKVVEIELLEQAGKLNLEPENKNNNKSDSNLQNAQKALSEHNVSSDAVSTSYGHSSKGFLAGYNDGTILLIDSSNNRVIGIYPSTAISRIANYKGTAKKTIQLLLYIINDTRDYDAENGAWEGNDHLLPIQVEYNYENGQHIPYMIKSGSGKSPVSYNNYLYEQKNVDAVNMIVEEAAFLK